MSSGTLAASRFQPAAPHHFLRKKRPSRRRVFLTANLKRVELLEGNSSASLFELGLDFLSLVLGNAFLDSLRSILDNFLGFLEAETGDLADNLDDSDLVVAEALEDDVELGLLLSSSSASSGGAPKGSLSTMIRMIMRTVTARAMIMGSVIERFLLFCVRSTCCARARPFAQFRCGFLD